MIPAYSPQARGRSERNFGTWQGRLPQELRIHGIKTVEAANQFLRERYIAEFNQRFQVPAVQWGSAFLPRRGQDLERTFSLQWERTVNRDNTVTWQNLTLQIQRVKWRATLTGCTVTVHQHLDATLSLRYGPHCLGRYSAQGLALAHSTLLPKVVGRPHSDELHLVERFRRIDQNHLQLDVTFDDPKAYTKTWVGRKIFSSTNRDYVEHDCSMSENEHFRQRMIEGIIAPPKPK